MKRLVFLIFITVCCITGFLLSGGVFSLSTDTGPLSVVSALFGNTYSGIISILFIFSVTLVLYRREIRNIAQAFYQKTVVRPAYYEPNIEPVLARRVESAEQRMADTEDALNKFSRAIEKYALHLSSHTGAIRGLNAASHELQKGAATQNRVLRHLMQNMEKPVNSAGTPHWQIDPPPLKNGKARPFSHREITEADRDSAPPGCARRPRRKNEKPLIIEPETPEEDPLEESPDELVVDLESLRTVQKTVKEIRAMQDKNQVRQNRAEEALAAEEEILKAIRRLNAQLDKTEFHE